MKGYTKPPEYRIGNCFICNKPCERYCHYECALAYAEHKAKLAKGGISNDDSTKTA